MLPRFVDRYRRRDQIFRKYIFGVLGRFTSRLAVESGDLRYFVSTRDLLGRQLYMAGHFELELLSDTLSLLAERSGASLSGRTFVDIGANIGTTVIPAVKTFGAGRAFAFEPEPANLRLLRQNLIENDLGAGSVVVVPVALSDSNQYGTLELGGNNWGDHRIRIGGQALPGLFREEARVTTTVAMRRFDDVAPEIGLNLGDVGLVWMDVQGHEGHVLSGAPSLLAGDAAVVTEYWPYGLRRASGLDLFHELVSAHYKEIIDLRGSAAGGRTLSVTADDILALEARYSNDSTDLLLLK